LGGGAGSEAFSLVACLLLPPVSEVFWKESTALAIILLHFHLLFFF
jgi:hypothetical protein